MKRKKEKKKKKEEKKTVKKSFPEGQTVGGGGVSESQTNVENVTGQAKKVIFFFCSCLILVKNPA